MPTFVVYPIFTQRPGEVSTSAPRNLTQSFECYSVSSDEFTADRIISETVSEVGYGIGSSHPSWPLAFCKRITAAPDDEDPKKWIVTYFYEEATIENGNGGSFGSPGGAGGPGTSPMGQNSGQPPRLSFRTAEYFREADENGKVYNNTAGTPLENVPPAPTSVGTITLFCKYDASTTIDMIQSKIGVVNSVAWRTFPIHSLRIAGADVVAQAPFWEVTWTIEYKRRLWIPTVIPSVGLVGRFNLPVVGWVSLPITAPDGRPFNTPVPLDHRGVPVLDPAAVPTRLPIDNRPFLMEFVDHVAEPFAPIFGA